MTRHFILLFLSASLLALGCKSSRKESAESADSTKKATPVKHEPKPAEVAPGGYMLPFFDGQKWGYMNAEGKVAIPAQFDGARYFFEGLACIRLGMGFGFIDTTGKVVIEPKYDRAGDFKGNRSRVRMVPGGPRAFLDRSGAMVIPPDTTQVRKDFSEGLCPVIIDKRYGYIDTVGKLAIPNKFLFGGKFVGGRAPVQKEDSLYAVIDRTGKFVLPTSYVYIDIYSEGLARGRVKQPDGRILWCFIDQAGKVAFTTPYDEVAGFKEGRSAFRTGNKWGFVDKEGRPVISPQFDFAMEFSEGLAAVRIDRGWGYVDPSGGMVIPLQFYQGEPFKKGVAAVTWPGGKFGFVDAHGNVVYSVVGMGNPQPQVETD